MLFKILYMMISCCCSNLSAISTWIYSVEYFMTHSTKGKKWNFWISWYIIEYQLDSWVFCVPKVHRFLYCHSIFTEIKRLSNICEIENYKTSKISPKSSFHWQFQNLTSLQMAIWYHFDLMVPLPDTGHSGRHVEPLCCTSFHLWPFLWCEFRFRPFLWPYTKGCKAPSHGRKTPNGSNDPGKIHNKNLYSHGKIEWSTGSGNRKSRKKYFVNLWREFNERIDRQFSCL